MRKPTVTIGIPAYNEAANIGQLLNDILLQKEDTFKLAHIIIASDASTDNTHDVVDSFKDSRIEFIDNNLREGIAQRQNQIFDKSTSDIVVLLDADIRIADSEFIQKLLDPIINHDVDLASGNLVAFQPQSFIEKAISIGLECKTEIYETLRNGNNLYTCHGTCRAFSKKLYTKMRFKESNGEDAYSYLYTVNNNFIYEYVPGAVVLHKLPETLEDHKRQSLRFFKSQDVLIEEFGYDYVAENYHLPFLLLVKTFLKYLMLHPLKMSVYIIIAFSMALLSRFTKPEGNTWEIAQTSKVTRRI